LKELLFLGLEWLFESSPEVADPGITAQVLGLVTEPRFPRAEVREVTQRPDGPEADVADGGLRA